MLSISLLTSASDYFKKMVTAGISPDLIAFSLMIDLYGSVGEEQKAQLFFKKLLDIGIAPDAITLNIMLKIYQKTDDINAAEAVFKILKKKFKPDIEAFNIMININKRHKNATRVNELLDEMSDAGHQPDIVTANTVLDMYLKIGSFKAAELLYTSMQRYGLTPDKYTHHIMHDVYEKSREAERIKRLETGKV